MRVCSDGVHERRRVRRAVLHCEHWCRLRIAVDRCLRFSQMKMIKLVTGVTPTCWRPPYGDVDVSVVYPASVLDTELTCCSDAGPHSCYRQRFGLADDHMEVRLERLARRNEQHHHRRRRCRLPTVHQQ